MGIGDNIKRKREQLGMTQQELANRLGYKDKSAISKIESGERNLTQSKIKAIADALDTTPGYIMGWEKDEPKIDMDMLVKAVEIVSNSKSDKRIDLLIQNAKKLSDSDLERLIEIAKLWGDK